MYCDTCTETVEMPQNWDGQSLVLMILATSINPFKVCDIFLWSSQCNRISTGAIPDSHVQWHDRVSRGKLSSAKFVCLPGEGVTSSRLWLHARQTYGGLFTVSGEAGFGFPSALQHSRCTSLESFYPSNDKHCWHKCSCVHTAQLLSDPLKPL